MESKLLRQDGIIKANSIEEILIGSICPFCRAKAKNLSKHFEECDKHAGSVTIKADRGWSVHNVCGKSLIIDVIDGLCLFVSDSGQYVSPAINFQFGALGKAISYLEDANLSDDEIDTVINILRLNRKEFGSLSEYPELWKGCKVDIVAGDNIHQATINKFLNPGYMVVLESGLEISIQPKHIIRII